MPRLVRLKRPGWRVDKQVGARNKKMQAHTSTSICTGVFERVDGWTG